MDVLAAFPANRMPVLEPLTTVTGPTANARTPTTVTGMTSRAETQPPSPARPPMQNRNHRHTPDQPIATPLAHPK